MKDKKIIDLFDEILEQAKAKYNSQAMFIDMEQECTPIKIKDNTLYVAVKTEEFYEFLQDIRLEKLNQIASKVYGDNLKINFFYESVEKDEEEIIPTKKATTKPIKNIPKIQNSKLDNELTFNNYIIGKYNQKATMLLQTTIKAKQPMFNPIFIYGNTGIGKTHLVNAFAFEFLRMHHKKKVKFIDAESFSREIYELIDDSNKLEEFKNENSMYDVFIMEDIQFLSDKQKSNEIFFTIFNNLFSEKHLIILTSDRFPEHLNGFTDRMISRFSSGIVVAIDSPDEQCVREITIEKIKEAKLKLTEDAIELIVRYHCSDIRKLLGSINNIMFMHACNNKSNKIISEEDVRSYLRIDEKATKINNELGLNPHSIINSIAKIYGLKPTDLIGPSRKAKNVNARAMAMYIMREKMNYPFEKIGTYFSNRNHSTIMSSINKFTKMLKTNPELNDLVEKLIKKL